MTKERMEQISLKIVIGLIKKEGVLLRDDLEKKIRKFATEFGIPHDDLTEYSRQIGKRLIDELISSTKDPIGFKPVLLRER